MFDATSYIMGFEAAGGNTIVLEGEITFVDDGDGNVTIESED